MGPFTSIDQNVKLIESEIEYSIAMAGAVIQGVGRIDHSLIGRNVCIAHNRHPPQTYHFVLGDNSRVQLVEK